MNKLVFVIQTVFLCEVGTEMLLLFEASNVLSPRLSSRRTASQCWGTLPYVARNCCSSAPCAVELFRSKYRHPKASAVAQSWHLPTLPPINQEIPRTPAFTSPIIATHHVTTKQYRSCHNYSAARVVYDVCTLPSENQTLYHRPVTPFENTERWTYQIYMGKG